MNRMGSSTLLGKITVLIAVCGWALSAQAYYSGGTGEPNNPFKISKVADWQELMTTESHWDRNFLLITDLDMNDVQMTPIGNDANVFTGVFDGNDCVIHNVDVNMPDSNYVGLFGYLGTVGQIMNLGVEVTSVLGGSYCGGIVGCSHGTITNCYLIGSVKGTGLNVGGLVGFSYSYSISISNCYSTASVSGEDGVGGLVGWNYSGTISNCYSGGSVSGDAGKRGTGIYVGGVGGLVGRNEGYASISNCYSTGFVAGNRTVGGLVGLNYGGVITNCYSSGSVDGMDYVGGLVGDSYHGSVASSFWDVNTSGRATSAGGEGKTTSQMQDVNTFLEAGWDFVGETANGTWNFWLIPQGGGYPVLSTFNGYIPVEPTGSGTEAEPYVITDANELGSIWYRPGAYYLLGSDVDLSGISWRGAVIPFFCGVFDGDHNVIRNADVNSPASDYVGLFGYLGTDGEISNLGVEDMTVTGDDYVGGLVGINYLNGRITDCYSTGSVTGDRVVGGLVGGNDRGAISNCYSAGAVTGADDHTGGLVGENYHGTVSNSYSTGSIAGVDGAGGLVGINYFGSTIANCYSTGSVTGDDFIGGLVGTDSYYSTITNCYSTSPVTGDWIVGGLVGTNYGSAITHSYAIGSVTGREDVGGLVGDNDESTISNSFWDVNASGCTTSDGGTPKTTAEMKTQTTFTSAGWDFIGETANGTEHIWTIDEGEDYPRFVWEVVRRYAGYGVSFGDYCLLAEYWGNEDCESSGDCGGVDVDFSGGIDFTDLRALAQYWLSGY